MSSWQSGVITGQQSLSQWAFDVLANARVITAVAILAMIAGTAIGAPPTPHAKNGGKLYQQLCSECHGESLGGGRGPPLRGADFLQMWQHKTARDLYDRILNTMPASDPGSLSEESVLDITIYLLSRNHVGVDPRAKPSAEALDAIEIKP